MEALTGSDWDTITVRAGACALTDGPGVLEARGLLPLINDTIILDGNQCTSSAVRSPDIVSSVSRIPSLRLVNARPNPTRDGWHVTTTGEDALIYTLYSPNGVLIKSGILGNPVTWIAADDMETGMYFLRVLDTKGTSHIEKLVLIAD
jgi:hypothetical protein